MDSYKLIRLPGHPNLNLIKYNKWIIIITIPISYIETILQEQTVTNLTTITILSITTKKTIRSFTVQHLEPKTIALEKL